MQKLIFGELLLLNRTFISIATIAILFDCGIHAHSPSQPSARSNCENILLRGCVSTQLFRALVPHKAACSALYMLLCEPHQACTSESLSIFVFLRDARDLACPVLRKDYVVDTVGLKLEMPKQADLGLLHL